MIKVYDQDIAMLAILDYADAVSYSLPHNDLWTATFRLPKADPKNTYCQMHNLVSIEDGPRDIGLYRIIGMPSDDVTDLEGYAVYSCEHVAATLVDDILFGYHEIGGGTVRTDDVMRYILTQQETPRWQLGTCEFSNRFTYKFENVTLLSALLSLGEVLTEPYTWDFDTSTAPWTINLRKAEMKAGCGIYYARNLQEITKTVDASTLVTRLYLLGYGEGVNQLTIKDINGGLPYLEADTVEKYGVKKGVFCDRRFENAESLKARGQALLDAYKVPYVTYTAKAADLVQQTGDAWDTFMPGKVVHVMDGEDGVEFEARIINVGKTDVNGRPGDVDLAIANSVRDIADSINALADRQSVNDLYSQGATNLYAQQYADNADAAHPAKMRVYIPNGCVRINQMLLSYDVEAFRAYETGASSGGGSTVTSAAGGGSTVTSAAGGGSTVTSTSGGGSTVTSAAGGGSTVTSAAGGGSTVTSAAGGGSTVTSTSGGGSIVTSTDGGSCTETTTNAGEYADTTVAGGSCTETTTNAGEYADTTAAGGGSTETTTNAGDYADTTAAGGSCTETTTSAGEYADTTAAGGSCTETTTNAGDYADTTAAGGSCTETTTNAGDYADTTAAGGSCTETTTNAGEYADTTAAGGGSTRTTTSGGSSRETSSSTQDKSQTSEAAGETTIAYGITPEISVEIGPARTLDGSGYATNTGESEELTSGLSSLSKTYSAGSDITTASDGGGQTESGGTVGAHTHGLPTHTHKMGSHSHGMSHSHTVPAHTHPHIHSHTAFPLCVIPELQIPVPAHKHDVTIPGHSHSVSIPSHSHDVTIDDHVHSVDIPGHSHSVDIPDHVHSVDIPGHSHSVDIPDHVHSVDIPGHSHSVDIPDHVHSVDIPGHSHSVDIPDHVHSVNIPGHSHSVDIPDHVHSVDIPGHSHSVDIPDHVHSVNIPGHSHSVDIPDHIHDVTIDDHSHDVTIDDHTHDITIDDHSHDVTIDDHTHDITIDDHSHDVTIDDHTHDITIDDHSHDVTIEPHTHAIIHGIFEGSTAQKVAIVVDGQRVPGLEAASVAELDIVAYLAKDAEGKILRGAWHTIELVPDKLTRIEASLFVQTFVQSVGGGNY